MSESVASHALAFLTFSCIETVDSPSKAVCEDQNCSCLQAASTAAERKAIAKQERERLKLQERLKRENLEKLRAEQAAAASADDVDLDPVIAGKKSLTYL